MHDALQADVVVIGAGLAGLAAACEAAEAGRRVIVLDQEPEQSLGGQAHWSLGGIFLVDSREQRRLGVTDSLDLARSDWFGSVAEEAGARVINGDRMWHYTEGLRNWNPVWHNHGIRILPGPSSLWLDARGNRLPAPCYPGFDTFRSRAYVNSNWHASDSRAFSDRAKTNTLHSRMWRRMEVHHASPPVRSWSSQI